jgi:hypothetical protein
MANNRSQTLESLRKSKDKLEAAQSELPSSTSNEDDATVNLHERRKKTYSLTNEAILAIEQMRFDATRKGKNLSASDIVNEAVLLLLKQRIKQKE